MKNRDSKITHAMTNEQKYTVYLFQLFISPTTMVIIL